MERMTAYKIVCKKRGKATITRYEEDVNKAYKVANKYERKGYNTNVTRKVINL